MRAPIYATSARLALALSLLLVVSANAGTISYTRSVPLGDMDWAESISVPRFNPAWGTLQGISFTLTGHVEGSDGFENRGQGPGTIALYLQAILQLQSPDSVILVESVPVASTLDTVPGSDGVLDYGGTSGKSYNGLSADKTETATSPPPASDLALFTGLTDIVLSVIATGTSHYTGPGNAAYFFNTAASAHVVVTYDWAVPEPVSPEPGSLAALVVGLVGLGVFVPRRLGYRRASSF